MGINRTPPPGGGKSLEHLPVTTVTSHTTTTTTLTTSTPNFTTYTSTGNAVCTPFYATSASSNAPNPISNNDLQRHLGVTQPQTSPLHHDVAIKTSIASGNTLRPAQPQTTLVPMDTGITTLSAHPHANTEQTHSNLTSGNYLLPPYKTQTINNSDPQTSHNSYSQKSSSAQLVISTENVLTSSNDISKKTKRPRSSPELKITNRTKQNKIDDYWLQSSTNRFAPLAIDEDEITSEEVKAKPPPIYVYI